MTKYLILLLFVFLINSCTPNKIVTTETDCPEIYISKEHRDLFSAKSLELSDTRQDVEMDYIATINNFNMECKLTERKSILSSFDILFIITPLDDEVKNYNFAYFVSILNNDNETLDHQLFNVSGSFIDEGMQVNEKEVRETLDQYLPLQSSKYKVVLGFVLTEDKYNFIND